MVLVVLSRTDLAVLALGDVLFNLSHEFGWDVAVEEVSELSEEVSTRHLDLLSRAWRGFACLK